MSNTTLHEYLAKKLEQKRKDHPSFRLMEIDDRLFPNAQTKHSTLVLEARNSNDELKTVAEIVAESWKKGDKNHLMIEGEGGIGKTVTLLSIPDKFTSFPVPAIYIPLHELPKGDDPIEGYIKKKILNGKAALYEQLLDLIDQTWDKGPHLLLLLDGFNEIAAKNRQIISEDIGHWSEYPGVQIVTSSRYDIHTYVALSYDYSTIKLQPLSDRTVEDYLSSASIPIPADSAVKKLITIPLLLTLYLKTELIIKQKETDSSCFWEAKNAGSIVWNYLQCELWNFGKEGEDAKNAIIAMEFIAPYIAWRMQQKTLFVLKKKEFHDFLKEAYQLLEKHFDKTEAFPFHISDAIQKSNGIPPLDLIRSLLENKLCLFVKSGNEYRLMHQQFRDALAAMHLINLSYLSGNSLPQEWNSPIDHYVMQFVVDLISEKEAKQLWEQNRNTQPAIEDAMINQLRLQGLLHNNDFSHLGFSGLDLSNISMYQYRYSTSTIKLPTQPERMVFTKISNKTFLPEGHEDSVRAIAVTPDGKRIVSGSLDNTIRIWDLEIGTLIGKPIKGHENWISAIAVSPDGKHIVSGSVDDTIRVWDLETSEPIGNPIEGHKVYAVAVTPDGKRIVSGSPDKTICIWDLETGTPMGNPIEGHEDWVNAIAVTPDGKRIVSGSDDKTIRVWDLETGASIGKPIKGHEDGVLAVTVTPDGKLIVSGSEDNTIRVWDLETGTPMGNPIEGHEDWVNAIAVTPDGKRIVSGSSDKTIRVWDLETGAPIGKPIKGHRYAVCAITVTPDGKRIVSGSNDNTIRVWDLETGAPIGKPIKGHKNWISAIAVTPDGKLIVSGSGFYTIRVWDLETGAPIGNPIEGHEDLVQEIAVTPDGKRIVSMSNLGNIYVWDLETSEPIEKPNKGYENWMHATTVYESWQGIVKWPNNNAGRIWVKTNTSIGNPIERPDGWSEVVAVTPDGKRIVGRSNDNTIRVWDMETGEPIGKPIEGIEGSVSEITVTPDGKRIVSGSDDGAICITDIETREVKKIKVHPLSFVGLDFSLADISDPELKETLRQNGAKVDPD